MMLYPDIEPYAHGMMDTGDGHQVYWELCGNPEGEPAIFLHGGPGGGCAPRHRRLFNPEKYNVLLFDQRGCGRSLPFACLENNTTWHLTADIERLRKEQLKADKIVVFGGSWGSTLSLAYAEQYPEHVSHLILRGIFTLRQSEIRWFYQEGASYLFPDYWEDFIAPIPENERDNLVQAYKKRLTGDNEEEKLRCAVAWTKWESRTVTLLPSPDVAEADNPQFALPFARIENHYFTGGACFDEGQIIRDAHKLSHIPTVIVQGRYDACTPVKTAWELYKQMPHARFVLIQDAGHAYSESGIQKALIEALDSWVTV